MEGAFLVPGMSPRFLNLQNTMFTKNVSTEIMGIELTLLAPATLDEAINAGVNVQRIIDGAIAYNQHHVLASRIRASISAFLNANSGVPRKTTTKGEGDKAKKVNAETDEVYAARVLSEVGEATFKDLSERAVEKLQKEGLLTISFEAATRGSGIPKDLKPYVTEVEARVAKNGVAWFEAALAKYDEDAEPFDSEGKPTQTGVLILAKVLKKKAEEASI